MRRLLLLLSALAVTAAAQSVHARPPAKKARPAKKAQPAKKARPRGKSAKTTRRASTPAVVRMPGGTLRKATGLPRLKAEQTLSKAAAAKALGITDGTLGAKVVLSPATALVGTSFMRFYCPTTVHPDVPMARFAPGTFAACGNRTGVGIRFVAKAGRRYLIDCAGTPGTSVTWTLQPQSHKGGAQTVANTEHPAFIYEAIEDGEVALDFNANTDAFFVHRCEVTPTTN